MQSSTKILIGVLSFIPIIILIIFLFQFFSLFFNLVSISSINASLENAIMSNLRYFFIFAFIESVLTIGLTIFFIIDIFKNPRLDKDWQIIWLIIIIFISIISFPVYWYINIWREPPAK